MEPRPVRTEPRGLCLLRDPRATPLYCLPTRSRGPGPAHLQGCSIPSPPPSTPERAQRQRQPVRLGLLRLMPKPAVGLLVHSLRLVREGVKHHPGTPQPGSNPFRPSKKSFALALALAPVSNVVAMSAQEAAAAVQDRAASPTAGTKPPGPGSTEVTTRSLDHEVFGVLLSVLTIEY